MEEAASTFKIEQPLDELVRDDSFYGWVWDKVPASSKIMLPRQYRMREPIGRVVSDLFYEGKLIHEAPHPADAAALAFRSRARVGRHRRAGRIPGRSAIGRQRVRGRALQGHHVDHPAGVRKAKLAVIAMYALAGRQPGISPQGHRSAGRHRVGRRFRGP